MGREGWKAMERVGNRGEREGKDVNGYGGMGRGREGANRNERVRKREGGLDFDICPGVHTANYTIGS